MTEKKDNTGLIIAVIIGLLIIIGVIAYMVFAKDKDQTNVTDDTNVTDNQTEQLSMDDVKGSYYGTFTNNDTEEEITETEDTTTIETTDETKESTSRTHRFELVLDEDGSAKLVRTDKSEDIIRGTYTVTDTRITLVSSAEQTDSENASTDNKTYEFTVNSDKSLTYTDGTKTITLNKTDADKLEHIK